MRVNEKLLLDFLSNHKRFVRDELSDLPNNHLPISSAVKKAKVDFVSRIIQELEVICGVTPEDYNLPYFCSECGWVGKDPVMKSRKEVYLVAGDTVYKDRAYSCPRCGKFRICRR